MNSFSLDEHAPPHKEGAEDVSQRPVSIVITTYNHARFLAEAIESALRQTVTPAEVIVVDDSSTDDPASVASRYPGVRLIRQHNQGLAAARNTGWRAASGYYVVFLDADDRLMPGLTGCVLDLGGGVGVTRHFLTAATHYVVLDPSLDWFSAGWGTLSKESPCLSSFPCFVHGIGERLPFHDDSFDAVVALWSLNHVRDPAAVLSEVHRVLVPGGRFIAVLEDMVPRWHDTLLPSRRFSGEACWHALLPSRRFNYRGRWQPRMFARKAWLTVCRHPWPLESDHLRILEQDIATWTS